MVYIHVHVRTCTNVLYMIHPVVLGISEYGIQYSVYNIVWIAMVPHTLRIQFLLSVSCGIV